MKTEGRRLYIYEVFKKGLEKDEFYCYTIYDSSIHLPISYPKGETQRAARKKCEQIIDISTLTDEVPPIVIWRNWPIVLKAEEMTTQNLIKVIENREITK